MAVRFGVTIDCRQPSVLASFWCRLLGFVEEPPPTGFQGWAEYDLAHGISAEVAESGCTIIDPEGCPRGSTFSEYPSRSVARTGFTSTYLLHPAIPGTRW